MILVGQKPPITPAPTRLALPVRDTPPHLDGDGCPCILGRLRLGAAEIGVFQGPDHRPSRLVHNQCATNNQRPVASPISLSVSIIDGFKEAFAFGPTHLFRYVLYTALHHDGHRRTCRSTGIIEQHQFDLDRRRE